jgi:hypothetical protein
MIAIELYRLEREVDQLEKQIEDLPYEKQGELKDRLRKVKAERNRMRDMLAGHKDAPAYRKPR